MPPRFAPDCPTHPREAVTKRYQQLWGGVTTTADETQTVRALAEILANREGRVFISCLNSQDVGLCIETLDNGIAEYNLNPAEKEAFFLTLRRLSERHGLLPARIRMAGNIDISDEILASGGFADLKSGTYEGRLVAVKTARVAAQDDLLGIRKRFYKEVVLWSTLSHPNILKLVGVQEDIKKRQLATVSEWMARGNVMEYIDKNHSNRLELLHGAAQGLKYLHGASLAHGDLKGSNILISNDTPPRACVADFNFITTISDPGQKLSCSARLEGGTMQFMSPELLVPEEFGKEDALPTPQADIYAFGLVIFQVLTGQTPFHGIRQSALAHYVLRGKRPDKPGDASAIGFSDLLWGFTRRCWDGKMELRPEVREVVAQLGEAAASWDGVMPPCSHGENVTSGPEEMSDSEKYGGLFQLPSGGINIQRGGLYGTCTCYSSSC